MRNCNVCDTELVLHENWWPSHFRNGNYICNKCHYEYKKVNMSFSKTNNIYKHEESNGKHT